MKITEGGYIIRTVTKDQQELIGTYEIKEGICMSYISEELFNYIINKGLKKESK